MKKIISILLAILATLAKAADIPPGPNITKQLLQKSKTIADMNLKDDASFQEMRKQLFDQLNTHETILLQEALENDNPDFADPQKPSPQTVEFVNKLDINDLPWLIEKTDFWGIQHTYQTLLKKVVSLFQEGKIDLKKFNQEIASDVAHAISIPDLNGMIKSLFQRQILPFDSLKNFSGKFATFSPDGSQIIFQVSGKRNLPLFIYDVKTNAFVKQIHLPRDQKLGSAYYNFNGSQILASTSDDNLFIYDTQSGTLLKKIAPLSHGWPSYDTHGYKIITAYREQILLYDTQQNAAPISINLGYNRINYFEFSRAGSEIVVSTSKGLFFYDTKDQHLIRSIPRQDFTRMPKYNSDDSHMLLVAGNKVLLFKKNSNEPQEIFNGEIVEQAGFSPDNSQILITTENQVFIYDHTHNQEEAHHIEIKNRSVKYSPDSSQILIELYSETASIYDAKKRTPIQEIPINNPEYSPDSSQIVGHAVDIGDKIIDITNKLVAYNTKTLLREKIKLLDNSVIARLNFSPNSSDLLIETENSFILYPTKLPIDFSNLTLDQRLLLVKAAARWKHIQPYTIQTKEDLETVSSLDPILKTSRLFNINISPQQKPEEASTATKGPFIYPTDTSHISLSSSTPEQRSLLVKAISQWKHKQPYIIQNKEEFEIYVSLNPTFKNDRLFKISFQEVLQDTRASSNTPVKDFFATLTHTVYRWLGKYNKPWPLEERLKEAEKEEEE